MAGGNSNGNGNSNTIMINATDLTTSDVRTYYVQPLIRSVLVKTNLTATAIGIKGYEPKSSTGEGHDSSGEGIVSTLYQEIALYKLESEVGDTESCQAGKSYAEILKEASALSAFLTCEEHTLITLVASSAFVSFLFPHCDYLKFLHSYFKSTSSNSASSHSIETLEERLAYVLIEDKGGAESDFPFTTPRTTSIGEAHYFYRFLHQGLASYFSCGMTLNSSRNAIRNQACNDMIQLISMVLYQPTQQNHAKSKSGAGTSMPSFFIQFSHLDKLHLLQVCKKLTLNPDFVNNNHTALVQLRESLFGFASFVAQSDKEAAIAYEALVNTSLIENKESVIQFELQRILQILVETKSSIIIQSISMCMQKMVLKYKGGESGDKTNLFSFTLRLFADTFDAQLRSGGNAEIDMDNTSFSELVNVAKRQKLSLDHLKSIRLTAIMDGARALFSTFSSNALQNTAERDPRAEAAISMKQLIQNASTLLQCSIGGQLAIVQSASVFLSLALSYETTYMTDTENVKHIFANVRKSLLSTKEAESSDIIDALKPVIIICTRQSGTFAASLQSFGIKNYAAQDCLLWKLITFLSIGNPFVVSTRLPSFENNNTNGDEEMTAYRIRTMLSLTHGRVNGTSPPDYLQRCLSLSESINDSWILFKLVRVAFQESNFSFARRLLENRLVNGCSRQQSYMWLTALSRLAHGEEVLIAKGAKGVAESFELLGSCNSILTSLAALERNGSFDFQLQYIRLRLDTLNLVTIARSLAVEVLMTEGTLSSKNNRSNLARKNISKSVGILVSRYEKMYRLFGFHKCHQTRSTLRTLKAMCQLISDSASFSKEKKNNKTSSSSVSTHSQKSAPAHDQNQSMNRILSKLRSEVVGQMKSSKQKDDAVPRASALLFVLDTILSHPSPFPCGFFQVKPIASAIVNISADPNTIQQKDTHDSRDAVSGAEIIDVMPGLTAKVILSGVIPDQFVRTTSITFHEIVAWATVEYDGELYEEENIGEKRYVESKQVNGYPLGDQPNSSTSLLPGGKFIMSIPFEELLQEGYYKVNIELGCIDIRGGKWIIPTLSPLKVIFRVDDE